MAKTLRAKRPTARRPERGLIDKETGARVDATGDRYITVRFPASYVERFKSRWPASGLPNNAHITVELDESTGDLVNLTSNRSLARADGSGALLAITEDANNIAARLLRQPHLRRFLPPHQRRK
jgi:hypothetical protein